MRKTLQPLISNLSFTLLTRSHTLVLQMRSFLLGKWLFTWLHSNGWKKRATFGLMEFAWLKKTAAAFPSWTHKRHLRDTVSQQLRLMWSHRDEYVFVESLRWKRPGKNNWSEACSLHRVHFQSVEVTVWAMHPGSRSGSALACNLKKVIARGPWASLLCFEHPPQWWSKSFRVYSSQSGCQHLRCDAAS